MVFKLASERYDNPLSELEERFAEIEELMINTYEKVKLAKQGVL